MERFGIIRKDLEKLIKTVSYELYLNWSGIKKNYNIAKIYNKYQYLFQEKLIREFMQEKYLTKRMGFLRNAYFQMYLENKIRKIEEKYFLEENKNNIFIDNKKINYRESWTILSNEENRKKRITIFEQLKKIIINNLTPIKKEKVTILFDIVKKLGYESYLEYYKDISYINIFQIEGLSKKILKKTDNLYLENISKLLYKYLNLSIKEAEYSDLSYLFSLHNLVKPLPNKSILNIYKKTLLNLGINLDRLDNIIIDIKRRKRRFLAWCIPLDIPSRIIVGIQLGGGFGEIRSFFHELTHALHYAFMEPKLSFEYKYLGDRALSETYAFLFELLLINPSWVDKYMTCVRDKLGYLTGVRMLLLGLIRKLCALYLYEIEIFKNGELHNKDKLYSKLLTDACKIKTPTEFFLKDVDETFYTGSYIQAFILSIYIEDYLKKHYGEEWFENHKCGNFLKKLWKNGNKFTSLELLNLIGYKFFETEILVNKFKE